MSLFTGQGTKTSSGSIVIKTANAGTTGVSGFLMFSSGTTSSGSSGELAVTLFRHRDFIQGQGRVHQHQCWRWGL